MYSNVLERQLNANKAALRLMAESTSKASRHQKTNSGRKRCRVDSDESDHEESYTRKKSKKGTSQDDTQDDSGPPRLKQPALISGATMKDYQLDGLEWMISLDQNGISGILGESAQRKVLI
jgi:ATP-dependent DNA helicase